MAAMRIRFPTLEAAHRATPFFIDEESFGIWLGTSDPQLLARYPSLSITRDAIHIPSEEKTGRPLPEAVTTAMLARARDLGLQHAHRARGYWTLSDSGELQVEDVIIAFSDTPVDRTALEALAAFIRDTGNQDAVAYEIDGTVCHYPP